MSHCNWNMRQSRITDSWIFECHFPEYPLSPFPLHRKMQVLYDAAAEICDFLAEEDLACCISVSPIQSPPLNSNVWQIIIQPNSTTKTQDVHLMLEAVIRHFQTSPAHFQRDWKGDEADQLLHQKELEETIQSENDRNQMN